MFIVTVRRFNKVRFIGGVQEGSVVDLRPVDSREEAYRFPSSVEAARAIQQVQASFAADNILANLTWEVVPL